MHGSVFVLPNVAMLVSQYLSCITVQVIVEVGAIGVTTTNLEQNVIFLHSYQKQVGLCPQSLHMRALRHLYTHAEAAVGGLEKD